MTAHQDPHSSPVDWDALAQCGLTLVVLMGARRAGQIATALLAGGRSSTTPVAVITKATLPDEHVERLALGELGRRPVPSPSVLVIGEVAASDLTTLTADQRWSARAGAGHGRLTHV
ncbi:MAG: SAM-dependent methyltransferase [Acidimicrobiales bacterium]